MAEETPKRTRDRKDYVQRAHAAMERTIERSEREDESEGVTLWGDTAPTKRIVLTRSTVPLRPLNPPVTESPQPKPRSLSSP
jgi:hypothetical protein